VHFRRSAFLPRVGLIACLLLALAAPTAAVAGHTGHPSQPLVLGPGGHPFGHTYREWSTRWWQWALSQPAATNPVLDATGEFCAEGQEGRVWFLAGSFAPDPVTRSCTVPAGKALFVPVIDNASIAFPTDPPAERTKAFVRRAARTGLPRDQAAGLSLVVDGDAVRHLERFYTESRFFFVEVPEGNILGEPAGTVEGPAYAVGFYVMLAPLRPGTHTVELDATAPFGVHVTYNLTVAPRH
jgi:hypothetical protein